MRDPFPIRPPQLMLRAEPLLRSFGLGTLHLHAHEVVFAFCFYHTIFVLIGPFLSRRFQSKRYSALSYEHKLQWRMKCVSFIQSTLISVLSLWVLLNDRERAAMDFENRAFGYTGALGLVEAFAVGYFVWDTYIMILYRDVFGTAMLVHGIACTTVYSMGFLPVLNYWGPVFMLYELSTPFLNIHWYLDKAGMTGSLIQIYNGVVLIAVFGGVRLIYGFYSSVFLYSDIWRALNWEGKSVLGKPWSDHGPMPLAVGFFYGVGSVILNMLNVYWFMAMIRAIRRRAASKPKNG